MLAELTISDVLNVKLKLPHEPFESTIQIATTEQVQDVRQTIAEQPYGLQYSCFHLEHNGQRMNDFVDFSEIADIGPDSVLTLIEDPYNEKEARIHFMRIKELIGASSDKPDSPYGISYGAALHDAVTGTASAEDNTAVPDVTELANYDFDAAASLQAIVPQRVVTPKTVKSISLSPWNPPPPYLRNKGHLLYLVVVNLEGDQYHITSHVSGFYINRSSHNKFDPSPKSGSKTSSAHSLLSLLHQVDSRFTPAFNELSEFNTQRDLLQFYPIAHAAPASPWLVSPEAKSPQDHRADVSRSQETYLLGGNDNVDNLRDWNEEFQVAKELPKENEAEKVFREKLTTKLYAEFTDAAVKGAVLLSRGELAPLNPTEERDAQIFVYNNVFFSFGVDGVGTFAATGGDDAARYATGKDVCGVRIVNQLDIPDLSTAATIIVDYLGRRIVAQSIVPGIFKQKEPHDSIDYGGVEGKDIIATKPMFVEPFAALAKATYVKRHAVWDAENKRHDLETSVETKGLLGTDGRKYALDLYKLQPLDVEWLEKYWGETEEERTSESKKDYPHRMSTLRPELVEAYRLLKLHEYIDGRIAEEKAKKEGEEGEKKDTNGHADDEETKDEENKELTNGEDPAEDPAEKFDFTLNPDVYSGQVPQTEEEKEEMEQDEQAVRVVCKYLTDTVIPKMVDHLKDADSSFPLDGPSLTTLLHKRGVNIRYLGEIASLADQDNNRLQSLRRLAIQEMVSRSIKHVAIKYFRDVPPTLASACMSHLLNCILGAKYNSDPVPEVDEGLRAAYAAPELAFESLTPEQVKADIIEECRKRFRYTLEGDIVQSGHEVHLLREISLKLGLQLIARDYQFDEVTEESAPPTNGTSSKKKKKSKDSQSPPAGEQHSRVPVKQTFHPDDVANFAPVIKDSCPKVCILQ
jgi:protein TIF31